MRAQLLCIRADRQVMGLEPAELQCSNAEARLVRAVRVEILIPGKLIEVHTYIPDLDATVRHPLPKIDYLEVGDTVTLEQDPDRPWLYFTDTLRSERDHLR